MSGRARDMLELRDLKRSSGAVRALDGLSFSVPGGALYGFVGRNGAGKTTAMRIVCGLLEPDEGEVRWEDRAIGPAQRMRIGYMPEERGLYQRMPARAQLAYFARLHGLDSPTLWPRRASGSSAWGWATAWTRESSVSRWATSNACSSRPRWCTSPLGRAVLGARSDRHRRACRGARRARTGRRPGAVLLSPARPRGASV